MNNITNESITIQEIWRVFNKANTDGEYLLSFADEEKIEEALKTYAEAVNDLHPREKPVLPLQNVIKRGFLATITSNAFWLGFAIGLLIVGFAMFYNGWLYGYVSRPHSPESKHKTINGLLTIQRVVRF